LVCAVSDRDVRARVVRVLAALEGEDLAVMTAVTVTGVYRNGI
jgi:hypothetical protein